MESISKSNLVRLNHNYLWHPFTQMGDWLKEEPLFIVKGEGNWLIDYDNNRYLDGVSSLWCNVHGHNRKEINEAIKSQVDNISHTTMLGIANVPATLLAHRLIAIAPKGLNKVFYSDSGATGVEIALKMAYQYWKQKGKVLKKRFIKLREAYHGDTIGSVSIGGIDLFHNIFNSLLFETYEVPSPFFYRSSFKSLEECRDHSLTCLRSLLDEHHNDIAGLFIEPYVQGAAGIIIFPKGFMKAVADICNEYNILFIADEVATGFGKTGRMFACQEDMLTPDIMILAKGISGGYLPLAATLTTDDIYNAFLGKYSEFKAFFHGHTYTGNPVACSASLASLDIFDKDDTLYIMQEKISLLSKLLKPFSDLYHVGDVRQKGFMVGIDIVLDKKARVNYPIEKRIGHRICMEARKHQLVIRNLGDVIVLMPPLSITLDELEHLTIAVYKSIISITQESLS